MRLTGPMIANFIVFHTAHNATRCNQPGGTLSEGVGADAHDQQIGHGEEHPGDAPLQVGSAADRIEQPTGRNVAAQDLEAELLELNRWVDWLRHTDSLTAAIIPPYWHRHPELVWEVSALHLHWLCAFDPGQNGSAPLGWHRDFTDARHRLRDWVTARGTRLDRDRPTRQTTWPGEEPQPAQNETVITDRDADFVQYVIDQVNKRQTTEDANNARGERPQKYDHYLKGTLYCSCEARLMIERPRDKTEDRYEYFTCSGQRRKTTNCTRSTILAERLKLVQAHYADAIPHDLLKNEQDRIRANLDQINTRLDNLTDTYAKARAGLDQLTELLVDLDDLYNKCEPAERRILNRALFTRITIDDEENATHIPIRPQPASSPTPTSTPRPESRE